MKRKIGLFVALGFFALSVAAFAATNYEENYIEADGYGLPAETAGREAQARLTARRAAIADAQRVLAEQLATVQVDAETTVQDAALKSDVVKTKVSMLLKGSRVIKESYEDGAYRVTVAVPLFGERSSLAAAVLPRTVIRQPFPRVLKAEPAECCYPGIRPSTEGTDGWSTGYPDNGSPYTGLIVDCRGLELRPAMSPVIKTTAGDSIYGYKNLDSAQVIRRGMAGYARSMEENAARAGDNPLIIRGVGVDRYFNPVVTAADGERILAENEKTHFLDAAAVVFVR